MSTEHGFEKLGFMTSDPDPVIDPDECEYVESITMSPITMSFEIQIQPKDKLRLLSVTNNAIRLHGGRPLRTVPKKFMRMH